MATILTIIGVGVSLAALHVSLFRLHNVRIGEVRQRVDGVEARLDQRITGLEERLDRRMTGLEHEMADVRERMAKLEGAVTGFMSGQQVRAG